MAHKLSKEDSPRDFEVEKSLETDEDRTESKLQKFIKGERLSIKQTNRVLKNSFLDPVQKTQSRKISYDEFQGQLDETLELKGEKFNQTDIKGDTEDGFDRFTDPEKN